MEIVVFPTPPLLFTTAIAFAVGRLIFLEAVEELTLEGVAEERREAVMVGGSKVGGIGKCEDGERLPQPRYLNN